MQIRSMANSGAFIAPVLLAFVALFVLGCRDDAAPADPEPADATIEELADGKLEVIVFPMVDEPFVAPNLDAGILPMRGGPDRFVGIDVDIMVAFAEHLGVEVEFVRLETPGFGDLIPALADGLGDTIASSLTINAERDEIVDFSRPYFEVSVVVVTRKDASIESVADLEGKIGVGVRGGLPTATLRDAGFTGEFREAEFGTGAYADVSDGEADFAVMESASARAGIMARPGLEVAFALPGRDSYGFAVREGSRLVERLDPFLDELEASGELERILTKYLGPDPAAR